MLRVHYARVQVVSQTLRYNVGVMLARLKLSFVEPILSVTSELAKVSQMGWEAGTTKYHYVIHRNQI